MRRPHDPEPTSVGQLDGLCRRHLTADVELVDALDPLTRRTVVAWLADRPSADRRVTCLRVLASWLRWLYVSEPGLEPLATSRAHLDAYCYAALTGGVGPPGRALAPATVAGRRAVLLSFHAYAGRCGAIRAQRVADSSSRPTREERRLLRRGAERLAGDGRHAEALAVALLEATGASEDALAALTVRDVHVLPGDDRIGMIVVREDRDTPVAYPIPPLVRRLLAAECDGRGEGDLLLRRPGEAGPGWIAAALTDAALAGGLPRQRAGLLHPRLLRAAGAHEPRGA